MKRLSILMLVLPVLAIASCSSDPDVWRGQAGGAMIGGLAGGVITDSWGGAAVGAAMGGLVGGEIARNR
jgi:hypothetical protein